MQQCAVLIFAKAPIEGLVKTRLIPSIGEEAVTRLYTRLLVRLVDWIRSQTPYAVELWVTPDREHPIWPRLAARYGLSIQLQQGQDLGERMGSAAEQALARHRHIALLGVDCPVLAARHLHQAFDWLGAGADAVLGPAEDGGYVLLGLNRYHRRLFEGHDWGSGGVAASTRAVLSALGWRWRELPELWDLDRPQDLQRLQLESPGLCRW
ncbi:MAG: TIGR04282 family arsenosugar biosynthesis glycosyltransferase [Candidatus Thiodiazotropha sp.]